jgi:hypothetical protein
MRQLLCPECGRKSVGYLAETHEKARTVYGDLRVGGYVCDVCCKALNRGERVCCMTMHPQGPDVVMPWEHEYLEKQS